MKNLYATIPVSLDNLELLESDKFQIRYGVNVTVGEPTKIEKKLGESAKANGVRAFRDARLVKFEVPVNEIPYVANLPVGCGPFMDDLRQAAKKYLAENAN